MVRVKKLFAAVMAAACALTFVPAGTVGSVAALAADAKDTTAVTYTYGGKTVTAEDTTSKQKNATVTLNTVDKKAATITVANTGAAISFVPGNNAVARVDVQGRSATVTPVAVGATDVTVTVGARTFVVPVRVAATITDVVTATIDGKNDTRTSLDLSTSTAANAKKTAKITGASSAGLTVKYDLYDRENGTIVAGNRNNIVSLSADGTVTAGTMTGSVAVRVYTDSSNALQATGASEWITVTVEAKPLAVITFASKELKLDVKNNKTIDLTKAVSVNATGVRPVYTVTAANSTENAKAVTVSGNTLTANQVGNATLEVSVAESSTTRATKATISVQVLSEIVAPQKADSDLALDKEVVSLESGKSEKVTALNVATGAAITFTSDDPSVATVDALGNITAVKKGYTVIRVKSTATDTVKAGSAQVVVIVDKAVAEVKKVTSVKVTGRTKSSSKVTVSWKKQSGTGITYQVQKRSVTTKTVKGKTKTTYSKWVTKTSTSAKASLSISKTKAYQIRVRAVSPTGETGSWSKVVTSKRPAK